MQVGLMALLVIGFSIKYIHSFIQTGDYDTVTGDK